MSTNYDPQALRTCKRCATPYAWQRSPASLKMTYCCSLCEKADLGFTLEALERWEPGQQAERTRQGAGVAAGHAGTQRLIAA